MARKLTTNKGQAVYARRKAIVEPVFGQILRKLDGHIGVSGLPGLTIS